MCKYHIMHRTPNVELEIGLLDETTNSLAISDETYAFGKNNNSKEYS